MSSRVLYVSEKFPWPVDDGGQIRAYRILKSMARSLPVTLIGLAPPKPEHVAPIEKLGVEVVTFPNTRTTLSGALFAGQAVFTKRPYPLNKNFSKPMLNEVRRRIRAGEVRALHLNQIDTAQYLDWLEAERSRVFTVFETQNVLATMYDRFYETAEGALRRIYCRLQARKMHGYEPEIMRKFDLVTVCSDIEKELLSSWGIEHAKVVPNGVDTGFFTPEGNQVAETREPVTLVFTGAMNYLPNREGFEWFLDQVVPLLRGKIERFRLLVVGKHPPQALLERAKEGELEFTGYVDDVRDPMREAQISVVPLRIGGGTRIKILEAMALGLPVVSTSVGAEGLEVAHDENILIADEAANMAEAVAALCRSVERRTALAAKARELVCARYDWDAVVEPLVDVYREAIGQPIPS